MHRPISHRVANAKRTGHPRLQTGQVKNLRLALPNITADILPRTFQPLLPPAEQPPTTGVRGSVALRCLPAMTYLETPKCPAWTRISRSAINKWHQILISILQPARQAAMKV